MKVSRDRLYLELRQARPEVFGYSDGAAALTALAFVENSYDDTRAGDGGLAQGLWQVRSDDWPEYRFPPPPFPAQVGWLLSGPALDRYNRDAQAANDPNLPRWWRHGHAGAVATPLDVFRELRFHAEYERLIASATPSAPASSPTPGPGGSGGGGSFPAAPPAVPTLGEPMTTTAAAPAAKTPSTLKQKVDAIRKALDKVRATVDQVAAVISSIPIIGPVAGGYVKSIALLVDGVDDAVRLLDDSLPA